MIRIKDFYKYALCVFKDYFPEIEQILKINYGLSVQPKDFIGYHNVKDFQSTKADATYCNTNIYIYDLAYYTDDNRISNLFWFDNHDAYDKITEILAKFSNKLFHDIVSEFVEDDAEKINQIIANKFYFKPNSQLYLWQANTDDICTISIIKGNC